MFLVRCTVLGFALGLTLPHLAIAQTDFVTRCESEQTLEVCEQAVKSKGLSARDKARAYNGLGSVRDTAADYDGAIADYDKAIEADPTFADAYNGRGFSLRSKQEHDRAIADFTEAIRLLPDFKEAYNNRGWALIEKGEYDKAIADLNEAIRIDPKLVWSYNNRGWAYSEKADYDRAIADLDEALRLDPQMYWAYVNRGWSYAQKGEHHRAIIDLSEAIRLRPDNASGFNYRGSSYVELGNYELAIADFDAALKLEDQSVYVLRGDAYRLKGDLAKAKEDYDRALEAYPAEPQSRLGRGLLAEAQGSKQDARAEYLLALSLDAKVAVQRIAKAKAAERLIALNAELSPGTASTTPAPVKPAPVALGKRVALVVGNAAYEAAGRLINTVHDANAISQALKRLGFDVVVATDVDARGFEKVLAEFTAKASGSDVAMFFYAGHALQADGVNYLLPVDAKLETEFALKREAISASDIIAVMEGSAKVNLVFLDACRNNPLAEKMKSMRVASGRTASVGRGLAAVSGGHSGTLIVYSTEPNEIADDGSGRNSPFANALLENIEAPGVEIEVMLKRVTKSVREGTGNKQRPERLSKLETEFYFKPAP